MELGRPYCHVDVLTGHAHVREIMRLEQQFDGAIAEWCCPRCHRRTRLIEQPPLDFMLDERDLSVILVTNTIADQLRVASDPIRIQVEPTDHHRVLDLIAARVEAS